MSINKTAVDTSKNYVSVVSVNEVERLSEVTPISSTALSQYVRAVMQGWRQGTVASKGRSDVSYTNKKPWKQKGTGRARAGSARSPLWRGGGVTFGPQERTRTLSVPRKVKRGVLRSIAQHFLAQDRVLLVDWDLGEQAPRTRKAAALLKDLNVHYSKCVVMMPFHEGLTAASFSNIPTASVVYFDQPNPCNLIDADYWIVFKRDIDAFKQMVAQWI